ncbi:SulP family inorganic anion transporter [Aminobacter sp. AP02]|uniref:SulP family inorganic anion transporter n=1 Tax=Aminobacter sp. AP02 TaxID=2135737 RepID=UPI001304C2BD|nr:SulP family inorganic anion transporter [Aminobacter sp. AP02]
MSELKQGGLGNLVPATRWLRGYEGKWFRADLVAGLTLAAYMMPAGIGDASLAGLPPEAGLYACLFSGLVFWLFCSSRHTAISVTSAISLLVGATLGGMAGGDMARYAALASCTALMVATMALMVWAVHGGAVIAFVSETVMTGFKAGVALLLASTQLPKLFGFAGGHGDFWERIGHFFSHLNETNVAALILGVSALALLLLGKKYLPNRPVALFVVVAGILVAQWANLGDRGVKLLGEVPQGLPPIGLPAVQWADLNDLLPLAMACLLLGAVETAAIGRTFARKHAYKLDTNQDLLALAAANLAAGIGQGYPVSGGLSQSLVNESSGARTPLSGLFAAFFILLVVILLSGTLRDLPQPVLAAVVLVAVTGLVQVQALKRLWAFSRTEFAVAAAAFLGVLGSGILRGVLIGAVISIIILLRNSSRPQATELGRVPGTDYFDDLARQSTNEQVPGVFIFRSSGAILYFNVDALNDRFFEMLDSRPIDTRLAVFFMGSVPVLDLAGLEMLEEIHRKLRERGIEFSLADTLGSVRETLGRAGFKDDGGPVTANEPLAEVIRRWQQSSGGSIARQRHD